MPFPVRDFRALLPQSGPRFFRQMRDCTFSFRRAGSFLNVSAGGAFLFCRRHNDSATVIDRHDRLATSATCSGSRSFLGCS